MLMRTHDCFQHSNWVSTVLPHGNRECENPVQEKKQNLLLRRNILNKGRQKTGRNGKVCWKSFAIGEGYLNPRFQRHKSPQGNWKISSGWLTFYLDLLVTCTLLEYQFACRACAPCLTEGCPKRVESGLSSLFSEEYFTASKSNHLSCCLFLITLFTGSSSGRESRLAEFLWHQHPVARLLFSGMGHYCQRWPSPVLFQRRKGSEITGKHEWKWADLPCRSERNWMPSRCPLLFSMVVESY